MRHLHTKGPMRMPSPSSPSCHHQTPSERARRASRPRFGAVTLLLALMGVVPHAWAAQHPVLADDAPSPGGGRLV